MKKLNKIKKLVVLIPAFNEEQSIGKVIGRIPKKIANIQSIQVLVLNDGSTDKTAEIAKKAGAIVKSHSTRKGLGATFKDGIEEALKLKADLVINIDADNQFNPADIPKLIEPILREEADVVTCSRFKEKSFEPKMPWIKRIGNDICTGLINWLSNQKFTDTQCGFRAYSREACLKMNLFGKFTYTQEVLLDLLHKGFRVKEVACLVRGEREKGESKIVSNWFDYGAKVLVILIRTMRDHKPLKFFGAMGLGLFLIGIISAFILWLRLLIAHRIDPFMWVVYLDVILMILGFLLMILALIADMIDRERKIQEEIRYELRRQRLGE